jgi:hypothetical protein
MRAFVPLLLVLIACQGSVTLNGDDDGPTDGDGGPLPGGGDASAPPPGAYFPAGALWYQDVSSAPVDPESSAVIGYLDGFGWATDGILQIDFGLEVIDAPAGTTPTSFVPNEFWGEPDCDPDPVPLPPGGAIEGESGYACTTGGDCHLIVADRNAHKLYEMWKADVSGGTFSGGCLAVWDMSRLYTEKGRGEQCTSADAAGYPIAPLLFTADEVAAGEIRHAIRFILPNEHIRDAEYVHPATHGTLSAAGPAQAPPYGAHLRLKSSFDESTLANPSARVVARALKKYGMFLADGGNVPLTAQSDRFTTAKWADLLGPRDLAGITPGDFELLEMPTPIALTLDCVREPK